MDFTAAFDLSRIAARIFKELAGDADSYTPNFPPTHSRLPTVMPPPGAPAFPDQSGPVDVIKQNKELKPTGSVRYQNPADPGAKDKKHKIVLQEHEDPAAALPWELVKHDAGTFKIKLYEMFVCAGEDNVLYADPNVAEEDADVWVIDPAPADDPRPNARIITKAGMAWAARDLGNDTEVEVTLESRSGAVDMQKFIFTLNWKIAQKSVE